jgi:hypothetical protein
VETEYRKKALAATNSTTSCSNTTSTASTMASSVPEQALLVVLCAQREQGGARDQGTLHLDPSSARDRELWLELVQKLGMYVWSIHLWFRADANANRAGLA